MNLHRAGAEADWAPVAPAARNHWQRLAARTGGIATPANAISVGGLLLVLLALIEVRQSQYGFGLGLLLAGRLADLLDGQVAEATGTKSPLGEKVDAGIDKLGTFLTIAVWAGGVMPLWLAVAVALPQLYIFTIALISLRRGAIPHPSRAGKYGMATAWVCLPVFLLAAAIAPYQPAAAGLRLLGGALALVSVGLTVVAATGYTKTLRR